MKKTRDQSQLEAFEEIIQGVADGQYRLRLYVTGSTSKSIRATAAIKNLCEHYLKDRYQLEVVDIYQQPAKAKEEQIIAAPTLVKQFPLPLRRFIGDMSNPGRILLGLDLKALEQLSDKPANGHSNTPGKKTDRGT